MEPDKKHRVCPVEHAGVLDFSLRKLAHNPKRILRPHVKAGMAVLDLGCGPGFFTVEMARLVGKSGKVVAVDLQQGMLEKARKKMVDAGLGDRVTFHLCRVDAIGLAETFDFILVFYMLHEVPDQAKFLGEIYSLLKPDGRALLAEPTFHVGRDDFQKSIAIMRQSGLEVETGPSIHFSRTVILRNASREDPGKQEPR
ncbi:MAG: class I SAM-dependent methyltransferase [Candidatus Aminicenantes bacterium]|nr:class I SAM-dependent methyltransferase [Candidatus Aminicenantes bacterium]